MFIKLFSQKGFSLPEVMIAVAMLGGVALVTAKLMEDQATQKINIQFEADVSKVVSGIETYLNDPVTCRQMLQGNAVPSSFTFLPIIIPLTLETKRIYEIGNYGSYSINSFSLSASTVGPTVIDFEVAIESNSKALKYRRDAAGKYIVRKKIPVIAKLDGANVLRDCGPTIDEGNTTAKQQMCQSLGGAATWTAGVCVLNSVSCPYGWVATRMTSLGGIICDRVENRMNLNEYFDTSMTNCTTGQVWMAVGPDGKMKLRCN